MMMVAIAMFAMVTMLSMMAIGYDDADDNGGDYYDDGDDYDDDDGDYVFCMMMVA